MLDKIILDSINDHLDLLADFQVWMLVVALAAIYTVISDADSVDLRVLKVSRRHAGVLIALLYGILQGAVALSFARLASLISLLPDSQVLVAFTNISTNTWLMNPFAYFSEPLAIQPFTGLVGLIFMWWASYFAATALDDSQPKNNSDFAQFVTMLPLTLFVVLGFASFGVEQNVYSLLLQRVQGVAPELGAELSSYSAIRESILTWGNLIAFGITLVSAWYIERYLKKKRRNPYEDEPPLPLPLP